MAARVLHIITGLNDGGAEGALYRLVTHEKNFDHSIISLMDKGKYGALLEAEGIPVYCVYMREGRVTLRDLIRLWRLIRLIRPTVVQTWLYHADLLGGLLARLCSEARVFWSVRHSNLEKGMIKRSTLLTVKLCVALSGIIPYKVISCSEKARDVHVDLGYPKVLFEIIPNGYDLDRFLIAPDLRESFRTQIGISKDAFLFAMVARFDIQKDHGNLIEALAYMKKSNLDFHCLLVGTGMVEGNSELKAMLSRANVESSVSLLGQRNDIPAVMNALDLHVLSSQGEAFPNVIAEAMACGTPCVATDVGDAALIIGDAGWVVPSRDSEALFQAIANARRVRYDDPERWQDIKLRARARIVNRFSVENMCKSYATAWSLIEFE